jgi:hypothetical protein
MDGGSVNHSVWSASFLEASLAPRIGSNSVEAVFKSDSATHGLATEAQWLQDEIGGFQLNRRAPLFSKARR